MQHERHFSVTEATALLPWAQERLQRIRDGLERLATPGPRAGLERACEAPAGGYPGRTAAGATLALTFALFELQSAGIVVRDPARGLIDFPALRDGREVYLCWLDGEEEIGYWHDPDAGFAGRQPL
jgi:uncharacterized protein DUF2203